MTSHGERRDLMTQPKDADEMNGVGDGLAFSPGHGRVVASTSRQDAVSAFMVTGAE